LEEQLAGVRLGAPFIDYDEEGRLKPDCLLAIYGMPTYLAHFSTSFIEQKKAEQKQQEEIRRIRRAVQNLALLSRGGVTLADLPKLSELSLALSPGVRSYESQLLERGFLDYLKMRQALGTPPSLEEAERMALYLLGVKPMSAEPTMPGKDAGGAAGTTGVAPTFPHPEELAWVIPPFVQLDINEFKEFYFIYCRHHQGAHLNFLMKLTGTEGRKEFRVVAITVAGRRYDGAQTAKGDPFKSIKLGDDLQRVLLRYGLPDEIVYYNPLTLQVVNTPTRNLILRYHLTRNIEFTILGDKVVRIFIFLPGQVTFNRR
jgi:hypothetical protein